MSVRFQHVIDDQGVRRCAVQQRCTKRFLGLLDAREIVSASGTALRPLSQQLRLDERNERL
jgi:hypothetical protein